MARQHPLFRNVPRSPGLLDQLQDLYGPKLGLLQEMGERPEEEMGLLNQALQGDKAASKQWMKTAMKSPFMGFGVGNIKAYHGSPHAFTKFSTKHIGKGEGAQAYGHGLYFAENPKVAQQYSKELTAMRVGTAQRALAGTKGDIDAAIRAAQAKIARLRALPSAGGDPRRQAAQIRINEEKIAELSAVKSGQGMSKGKVYEVNIKPDPPDFLDWDKPLSQQSEKVRKALAQVGDVPGYDRFENPALAAFRGEHPRRAAMGDVTGQDLYNDLSDLMQRESAVKALRKAGIRGIKYKDAGSRASGKGTDNYVVFDEADVEIKGLLD